MANCALNRLGPQVGHASASARTRRSASTLTWGGGPGRVAVGFGRSASGPYVRYPFRSSRQLFENLNARFYQSSGAHKFISLIYGEISEDARFRFLSAAQPFPVVFFNQNDRFMEVSQNLRVSFPPLGIMPSLDMIDGDRTDTLPGFKTITSSMNGCYIRSHHGRCVGLRRAVRRHQRRRHQAGLRHGARCPVRQRGASSTQAKGGTNEDRASQGRHTQVGSSSRRLFRPDQVIE